jgi:hypothetical protein
MLHTQEVVHGGGAVLQLGYKHAHEGVGLALSLHARRSHCTNLCAVWEFVNPENGNMTVQLLPSYRLGA